MDRLTKSSYFIMNIDYLLENLSQFISKEIVRLHNVHSSIVSDQCPKFTYRF